MKNHQNNPARNMEKSSSFFSNLKNKVPLSIREKIPTSIKRPIKSYSGKAWVVLHKLSMKGKVRKLAKKFAAQKENENASKDFSRDKSGIKISQILAKYETDKVNGHCYGDSYDELFARFDRNAPLNILEIGTQKGGSLCAWRDYFQNAKITGVDIVDAVKPEYRRKDINYILCDVKKYSTDEEFDIVIDDGSHFYEDAMHAVRLFEPKIKKGGIMVIEDVQSAEEWMEGVRQILGGSHFTIRDLRGVHFNNDDFLIVIEK